MKAYIAEVVDDFDPLYNQSFTAKVKGKSRTKKINFTSPYATRGEAGMVGNVPTKGSVVVVFSIDSEGEEKYYYLCSLFEFPEENSEGGSQLSMYKEKTPTEMKMPLREGPTNGKPKEVRLQHEEGQGLKLRSNRHPETLDVRAELYTKLGKRVALIDNPRVNKIIIDADNLSEKMARIELSGDDAINGTLAHHAYRLTTTGPQQQLCIQDQIDIEIQDGQELNIANHSTGTNAPNPLGPYWGNVNIQSKNRDINVFTKAADGRIFIECLNNTGKQEIVIDTNSPDGKITISAGSDVNIVADKVSLEAKNKMRLVAGGDLDLGADGNININSGGNVNIDGGLIELNSGKSSVDKSSIGPTTDSVYGNLGIGTL